MLLSPLDPCAINTMCLDVQLRLIRLTSLFRAILNDIGQQNCVTQISFSNCNLALNLMTLKTMMASYYVIWVESESLVFTPHLLVSLYASKVAPQQIILYLESENRFFAYLKVCVLVNMTLTLDKVTSKSRGNFPHHYM